MINITSTELETVMASFVWPLFRILALIASAPILGNPSVPARVKAGLAVLVTLLVAPTIQQPMPQVDPFSGIGLMILIQQIVIGIAIGMVMRIVFVAVEMAGEIIGLQMGLAFAVFFDPQSSGRVALIGRFLGVIASLAFLAIDGHLLMIALIAQSFNTLPIGTSGIAILSFSTLAEWGGEIFKSGLQLALPVLAALLITNLALGILTRAAPQLNIFAVGFPLTLSIGFLMLALSINFHAPVLETLIHDGFSFTSNLVNLPGIALP